MSTYSELLKDPKWQLKKSEILIRDNGVCRFCGSSDRILHVHHIQYIQNRKPWEYESKYLITLCDLCHEKETLYRKQQDKELTLNFANIGFSYSDIQKLNELLSNKKKVKAVDEFRKFIFSLYQSFRR